MVAVPNVAYSTCEEAGTLLVQLTVALERVMLLVSTAEMSGGTAVGVLLGVLVAVGTVVAVGVTMRVGVALGVVVLVGAIVRVGVAVAGCRMTSVAVGPVMAGVEVGVGVPVAVGAGVGVAVGDAMAAALCGMTVFVAVAVALSCEVGVRVGVGVCVGPGWASLTPSGSVLRLAKTSTTNTPRSTRRPSIGRPECHRAALPVQGGT